MTRWNHLWRDSCALTDPGVCQCWFLSLTLLAHAMCLSTLPPSRLLALSLSRTHPSPSLFPFLHASLPPPTWSFLVHRCFKRSKKGMTLKGAFSLSVSLTGSLSLALYRCSLACLSVVRYIYIYIHIYVYIHIHVCRYKCIYIYIYIYICVYI